MKRHRIFWTAWWSTNVLFAAAVLFVLFAWGWEYSVRQYLKGFSDAIVPATATPEQKVEAILEWMRTGPGRNSSAHPSELAYRNPQDTLNYRELLEVCGTATNAFLNLGKSAGLNVRRLLLLGPDRRTRHVVAEVLIDGRWIVVDPAYRIFLRDAQGSLLTRQQLKSPAVFEEAIGGIPNYSPEYNYGNVAHIRLARIPLMGLRLRRVLDWIYPGWDELFDWSLVTERESFALLFGSCVATILLFLVRVMLAWYADRRLHLPRVHLHDQVRRAGAALFSGPELK
jgi:Transglutaminase-like superfamily